MGVPAAAGGRLVPVGVATQDDDACLAPVAAVDDVPSLGDIEDARIGQDIGSIIGQDGVGEVEIFGAWRRCHSHIHRSRQFLNPNMG